MLGLAGNMVCRNQCGFFPDSQGLCSNPREATFSILRGGERSILNISRPASAPARCGNRASPDAGTLGAWPGCLVGTATSSCFISSRHSVFHLLLLYRLSLEGELKIHKDLADLVLPEPGVVLGLGGCFLRIFQIHEGRQAS